MSKIEQRLAELNITLPTPAAPVANYVGFIRSGNQVIISGQLCLNAGKLSHTGKVGASVSKEEAKEAARYCAINVLAQLKAAAGSLDNVAQCIRLGGFINSDPAFADLAYVMNGASDLMVEVFGDQGKHARSTVGVAELPLDAAVEVEALFEIKA
ncbi:RidA family protein [Microvirga sp. W0021]|uniref:RidA family protein n=1 Tax=Hohaiivirga grylli TaxID=3133970 RepID=A0ABV0BID8_9HYPH